MESPASSQDSTILAKADRIGIGASILCAIHCAAAPFLLLLLPAFGKIWAHPLSHILVAMLVVPLAAFSIRRGYLTHQKKWVLVTAYIGIFVVLTGATLPAFSKEPEAQAAQAIDSEENLVEDGDEGESVFTFSVNGDSEAEEGESTSVPKAIEDINRLFRNAKRVLPDNSAMVYWNAVCDEEE